MGLFPSTYRTGVTVGSPSCTDMACHKAWERSRNGQLGRVRSPHLLEWYQAVATPLLDLT